MSPVFTLLSSHMSFVSLVLKYNHVFVFAYFCLLCRYGFVYFSEDVDIQTIVEVRSLQNIYITLHGDELSELVEAGA